jgi:hypothetical protein
MDDQTYMTLPNGEDQLSVVELEILCGQTRSAWHEAQRRGDLTLEKAFETKLTLLQKARYGGYEPGVETPQRDPDARMPLNLGLIASSSPLPRYGMPYLRRGSPVIRSESRPCSPSWRICSESGTAAMPHRGGARDGGSGSHGGEGACGAGVSPQYDLGECARPGRARGAAAYREALSPGLGAEALGGGFGERVGGGDTKMALTQQEVDTINSWIANMANIAASHAAAKATEQHVRNLVLRETGVPLMSAPPEMALAMPAIGAYCQAVVNHIHRLGLPFS